MLRSIVLLFLLATLRLNSSAAAVPSPTPKPSPTANYDIQLGIKIPLHDGVELNATLYLPSGREPNSRSPVIFTFTPYISDEYHERGAYFATHGYVFALIDVRGRGNSGGDFVTFVNEGPDGKEVVAWLARQPFCDGKVAMWGGSYAGFDQWSVAKELPPNLATIVPAAAVHPGVDAPFYNNIGQPYDVRWLTFTWGRAAQNHLFADQEYWRSKFSDFYRQHLAFRSLDQFMGTPFANFQRFLQHPSRDSYYDALTPSAEQFARIDFPILTITGQYDDDQLGALTYYRDHFTHGNASALSRHYLVIGPWDHLGTRTSRSEVEGIKFGPASLLDLNDLHRQWYDWTMKGGARPSFLKKKVAYYLLAAGNSGQDGEWRYADSYAELTSHNRRFYLDSKETGANGVFQSGILTEKQPQTGADHFVDDPLDNRRGEKLEGPGSDKEAAFLDQSYALSIGQDGLVYHTAPLPAGAELVGCPKVSVSLKLNTPDADLQADLYEIQPDGTSIFLWESMQRLRYRKSPSKAELVKPGEVVQCDFAPGLFLARKLVEGSRLRLVISAVNSIWQEKNYNTGGIVADETGKDARIAQIELLHDAQHASRVELPLQAP